MKREVLDCTGMNCPLPVINTRKAISKIKNGILEVIIDNEIAKTNLEKLAKNSGIVFTSEESDGKYKVIYTVEITEEDKKTESRDEKFTVIIASDEMGQGDSSLGKILMKGYIFALSESENKPTDILMYNSGVKIAVEGSVVVESLKKLENEGVKIQVCGTCLDFFEVKDKLLVGEISNMYNIVETMNSSDKVIKI